MASSRKAALVAASTSELGYWDNHKPTAAPQWGTAWREWCKVVAGKGGTHQRFISLHGLASLRPQVLLNVNQRSQLHTVARWRDDEGTIVLQHGSSSTNMAVCKSERLSQRVLRKLAGSHLHHDLPIRRRDQHTEHEALATGKHLSQQAQCDVPLYRGCQRTAGLAPTSPSLASMGEAQAGRRTTPRAQHLPVP